MLKPKRNIISKEIEVDPLVRTMDRIEHDIETNKKKYLNILIAVLVIVVGGFFLNNQSKTKELNSEIALGKALVSLEIGDLENAKFQFESIAGMYASTNSGKSSNYFLGKLYFDEGSFLESRSYLESYISDPSLDILNSSTAIMLSSIYSNSKDVNAAFSVIKKELRSADAVQSIRLNLELAKLYCINNDYDKAKVILDDILGAENLDLSSKSIAQELLGSL